MLLLKHQKEAIYYLLPSNRWPDQETKQHNGSVPQSFCQSGARRLGKTVTNSGIYLQQYQECETDHTPFEFNYGYYPRVFFEEDVNFRSRSCSTNELEEELRKLIKVYCQNLLYAQKLQKKANDKGVKSRSYAPGKKVWLNSKYIKTKRNKKLESKFFGPFRVLYVVEKQANKLQLPIKWTIYDVFYVSLLE